MLCTKVFIYLCCIGQMTSEPLSIQSSGPLNDSSQSKEMANDVQRDQGAPPLQPHVEREPLQGTKVLPTTMADTPTDAPFISFPVTKTPGKSRHLQSLQLPTALSA